MIWNNRVAFLLGLAFFSSEVYWMSVGEARFVVSGLQSIFLAPTA